MLETEIKNDVTFVRGEFCQAGFKENMSTSDESNTIALTSLRLKLVKFYKINYSCFHFIPQFYLKPATVNEKCIWKESFATKKYYVQKIWLVLQFKKKNHIPKKNNCFNSTWWLCLRVRRV